MLKNNYGEHTSDTSLIFRVVNHFSPKITMYNQCPSHYFSFRIVYLSTKIMKKKSDGQSYLHTEKESNHILFTYINNSFIQCRLYLTFGPCQTESYRSHFIYLHTLKYLFKLKLGTQRPRECLNTSTVTNCLVCIYHGPPLLDMKLLNCAHLPHLFYNAKSTLFMQQKPMFLCEDGIIFISARADSK